jgi:prevent-host-death family protein
MTIKESRMMLSAAEFKSKCLKIMDEVNNTHEEVVITKHGKPVAKLVPYSEKPAKPFFGYMKNSVKVTGDITESLHESWNAEN